MKVKLKFKTKKYYLLCASFLTVIEKDDTENTMIIHVYDKWSAGQIILPLESCLLSYQFI